MLANVSMSICLGIGVRSVKHSRRRRTAIVDQHAARIAESDHDHVQSAVQFIAEQFGGPQRVLAHHRKTSSGLCAACSSVHHVLWPCLTATMAQQAATQQK
jgi:hypothetical protein